MPTSTVKNLPKATAELEVSIPWDEVKDSYEKVLKQVVEGAEIPGFRKGKAPREMVEKQIDKTKIYQEVVKQVIPKAIDAALKEHNLSPITTPKVEVLEAQEDTPWKIKATIALRPVVKLGKYKDKVKAIKKPQPKIWTPGSGEKPEEKPEKPSLDQILGAIAEAVEVEMSDVLIAEEANRMLADLMDQTHKLGLTVEQYLLAKGKTTDQIRAEYARQAEQSLKLQFALLEIADQEKITVTQEDIDGILSKIEKPEERQKLASDSYYLAHLIRQQKTIDFLNSL